MTHLNFTPQEKAQYDVLMTDGVRRHNGGDYLGALDAAAGAFKLAPDGSSEQGNAARDVAARLDRLGKFEQATDWADMAYSIHDTIVKTKEEPDRQDFRQRAASAVYAGVCGLRGALATELQGDKPTGTKKMLGYMRQAWFGDIIAAKSRATDVNQQYDQFEINAARRVSMAESLYGSKDLGMYIGVRAVRLAFMSESPQMDTSTPRMTTAERRRAKVKAFVGAGAALAVNALVSIPGDRMRKPALQIANKTL